MRALGPNWRKFSAINRGLQKCIIWKRNASVSHAMVSGDIIESWIFARLRELFMKSMEAEFSVIVTIAGEKVGS